MSAAESKTGEHAIADALADGLAEVARAVEGIGRVLDYLPSAVTSVRDAIEGVGDIEAAIKDSFRRSFVSPAELDREGQRGANSTDGLFALARALEHVALAVKKLQP